MELIEIINNFLIERNIGVYNDQNKPEFLYPLTAGVPQGSVLGPILFNIVMSTIHEVDLECGQELVSYADDMALLSGINQIRDLNRINCTINKLNEGLTKLNLQFNEGNSNDSNR